jgi:two-component system sensor histidine kinase/response regulator
MTFGQQLELINRLKKDRILVVDDEEFCLTSLIKLISKTGFDSINRIDQLINGREALELVQTSFTHGVTFKLILTDFSMPEMDGLESTRLIRQFYSDNNIEREHQPTIVGLTGHAEKKFKTLGLEAGMDDVISKPIYFLDILMKLQDLDLL